MTGVGKDGEMLLFEQPSPEKKDQGRGNDVPAAFTARSGKGVFDFSLVPGVDLSDRNARIERLRAAGIPDAERVVDSDPPPLPPHLAPRIVSSHSEEKTPEVDEEPGFQR